MKALGIVHTMVPLRSDPPVDCVHDLPGLWLWC